MERIRVQCWGNRAKINFNEQSKGKNFLNNLDKVFVLLYLLFLVLLSQM